MKPSLHGLATALLAVFGCIACDGSGSPPVTTVAPSPVIAAPPFTQLPVFPRDFTFLDVTLSGVVSEDTPTGRMPIEGVWVYCEPCTRETHAGTYTDARGFYSFTGVWREPSHSRIQMRFAKPGYTAPEIFPTPPRQPPGAGWRELEIDGDTRFDLLLVRQ